MLDRLQAVEDEFVSLESSLSDPDIVSDQARLRDVTRRYKDLTPVVECVRRIRSRSADVEAARELLGVADDSERDLLRAEISGRERPRNVERRATRAAVAEGPERRARSDRRDPRRRGRRGPA